MKESLRITRRAFFCIVAVALIVFGARFSAAAEHPSIIGEWVNQYGGEIGKGGEFNVFVFKADNTVLWIMIKHELAVLSGKYTIDYSTKPIHLDVFEAEPLYVSGPHPNEAEMKAFTWRGILEFEGESRFRFDTDSKGERPKEFGENARVFEKEGTVAK